MHALRILVCFAAAAVLAGAYSPSAAAYTCTPVAGSGAVCDINDDGIPDFVQVWVPGQASFFVLVYRDAAVVSTGASYVTYGAVGYHGGGVGVGCYDPDADLDCEYASVAAGSTDAGYIDVQKFGDRVQVCRYNLAGYQCVRVL